MTPSFKTSLREIVDKIWLGILDTKIAQEEIISLIRQTMPEEKSYGGYMDNDNVDGFNSCRQQILDEMEKMKP